MGEITAKQQLSRNPQNAGYATPLKTYSVPASENEDKTISVPASPVFGIDPNHEPIDLYMATRGIPGGVLSVLALAATGIGAGGLTFQIPATVRGRLISFTADLTATATVGNRILQCRLTRFAGQVVWVGAASTAVAAAQVGGYDVAFGSCGAPSTTVRRNIANTANTNVQVRENSPITEVGPGDFLNIDDSADIDNADTVTANLYYVAYTP